MKQREIEYSIQFQRDVKKAQKCHKDIDKLKELMKLLINDELPLPEIYKDHRLQGDLVGLQSHLAVLYHLIYGGKRLFTWTIVDHPYCFSF
ncbi:type II toxin-antitoxin system mRNA interferase toxin, RelE/StbE family [Xenorhabdus khoisanae]|uniref:type II toxin-antitoxin system RelE/ParE family toxin n=1 Tax=Xenorhabdus khoisanae TaxID=880157 RepID=UPI0032B76D78